MPEPTAPTLLWQGEDCLVLHWPPAIDAALNRHVHCCATALRAARWPGLRDLVPAYASLALYFEYDAAPDRALIEARVQSQVNGASASPGGPPPPAVELPVCYHPSLAPDLLAAAAQLGITPAALAHRHAQAEYQVAMIGFAPGFPYLLGLDPALALPRHAQPRARVAAGSVGIAGAQTGIYPQASPGGWQLIGRTPWSLFDPHRNPPTRLLPGQRLCFKPIEFDEFALLSEHEG